ncbi:hypothetical protein F511_16810 [Dorcoceras hygrometricum]|uniref:Acyl-CoA dehydrogenase-related protein n=1 Tax=Dorcoceras hygrometricum TaxID=472368 RepID=A0A2Z7C4P2_9LAMI|nr:hypothetical protein F511_16810 [Dorcoceras hygrometricum]
MSLFDLQDVCIVIGSIATLDLPMVVDLIGIYGLKGPYYTLTTTDWFLQALSAIPRGSWGDVARRFTMIRWAVDRSDLIRDRSYDEVAAMDIVIWNRARWADLTLKHQSSRLPPLKRAAAAALRAPPPPPSVRRRRRRRSSLETFPASSTRRIRLLVQSDEGVSNLVVDRIDVTTAIYREAPGS